MKLDIVHFLPDESDPPSVQKAHSRNVRRLARFLGINGHYGRVERANRVYAEIETRRAADGPRLHLLKGVPER